jgi:hypothetical protein
MDKKIAERLADLRMERLAKLDALYRALARSMTSGQPFGFSDVGLMLEVIQIEARIAELQQ